MKTSLSSTPSTASIAAFRRLLAVVITFAVLATACGGTGDDNAINNATATEASGESVSGDDGEGGDQVSNAEGSTPVSPNQPTTSLTLSDVELAVFEEAAADGPFPVDFGSNPLPGCRDFDLDVLGEIMGLDFEMQGGRDQPGVSPHRSCAFYDANNQDRWDNLLNFDIAPAGESDQYIFELGADDPITIDSLTALDSIVDAQWNKPGSSFGGYSVYRLVTNEVEVVLYGRDVQDNGLSADVMAEGLAEILRQLHSYSIPGGDGIVETYDDLAPVELDGAAVTFAETRFDNSMSCLGTTADGNRMHVLFAAWERSPFFLEDVLEDLRPFEGPDPIIDVLGTVDSSIGVDQAWRIDDQRISQPLGSPEDLIAADEVFGLRGTELVTVSVLSLIHI